MKEKVYSKPSSNLVLLQAYLYKAASHIDMDFVRPAIHDWPHGLKACIHYRGGPFEYF